jgi:pyruvate/2-oxoglutarate dehydrogenase complex dihydrolipoamide acyltransferase (E2) component
VSSSRTEALVDVTMPQMGVSVAEGTVVAWRVEVGDRIEADQTICEISTDKIDTEVPAPVTGVVTEILVPVNATVDVGVVLARIVGDEASGGSEASGGCEASGGREALGGGDASGGGDIGAGPAGDGGAGAGPAADGGMDAGSDVVPDSGASPGNGAAVSAPQSAEGPATGPAAGSADGLATGPASGSADGPATGPASGSADGLATGPASGSADGPATGPASGEHRRYSPVVQRMAAEHRIDLSQVPGTGRGGRVRKQDVLAFLDAVPEPPLHIESPYRPEPAPASAGAAGGGATQGPAQLSRMRRQIGEHMKRSLDTAAHCTTWIEVDMSRIEAARAPLGFTALPFVARAAIAALREHPSLNAWLDGELYTRHDDVNLGIAVSLGEDGLIVPVVHQAHELSVEGLAARIKDIARRARARELTPDEVRGGTFTITNPGQYGSIMATPIINQPQVAILDLEAVVKHPVVMTDALGNDSIAIRPTTILGLSWDHRALDGAIAAQFLASMKRHLEGWTGA